MKRILAAPVAVAMRAGAWTFPQGPGRASRLGQRSRTALGGRGPSPRRHRAGPDGACLQCSRRVALALPVVVLFTGLRAQQATEGRDSAVKATFLYRFAGFVEWPPGVFDRREDPVVIGVWGDEAVAGELDQVVAGRTVEGRPVLVRRLRDGESVAGVHVLMIGEMREQRVREIASSVAGPVLVVTEQDNGLRLGGVLNFVTEGGRVRFAASLPAAEARGLRLSARLLALAQTVEGKSR